jgi:hypothetical protein
MDEGVVVGRSSLQDSVSIASGSIESGSNPFSTESFYSE